MDWIGKMRFSCFNIALSDFYNSHAYYKTRLLLHTRNSNSDVVAAAAGPENSMQANFIIELGDKAHVPILSFSATSPSLTSLRSPYFIRVAKKDSSQVKAISAIVQAFGWREAVPIDVDNEFREGIIPYLIDARVPYRSLIPQRETDDQIVAELYKLMTMQTRVFIVHMLAPLGSRLFIKAKEIRMMDKGYVWIMTDGITNLDSLNSSVIDSMQGMLGVRTYVAKTKELENFIEEIGSGGGNFSFKNVNISGSSSIDLETIGINQNGPELGQALKNLKFKGLAGDFRLVDGQLQSSIFEILNVNGRGERRIGFWTQKNGLSKRMLDETNSTKYCTLNTCLGPIIWPGDSTYVPRGWEIPTKRTKRNEAQEKSLFCGSLPNINCPPSPSWYSCYTHRSNFGGSLSDSPEPGHGHSSITSGPNGDQVTMEIINLSSVDDDHELTFPSPSTYPHSTTT
ncbi:hypothetical protein FEM48_Zijuj06G0062500 [Ziziphus jujuba var. spinosa]|uniref:Receptor ligand binding region domain-containing protein n=1 Tax=Ziziphus jujuba var. spinosa TaxID=714518 RepID=A0A978V7M8_ZIZJJ|nr:hypothetical protein FEM48_Zijuj06G0062500 [Ziziphus jujuba var. spinosa]